MHNLFKEEGKTETTNKCSLGAQFRSLTQKKKKKEFKSRANFIEGSVNWILIHQTL